MNAQQVETGERARGFRWILWVVAAAVLLSDQWSKAAIIRWLALGESWRPLAGTPLLEWFAFTHTKNSGAAFGMFPSASWFFVAIAIVVSAAIIWYYPRLPRDRWWLFLALGLQLGGALGNLVDRLRLGHVTDFVHIGSFAIFNVADSAVVVGVSLLALHFYLEDLEQERAKAANPAATGEEGEWDMANGHEREPFAAEDAALEEPPPPHPSDPPRAGRFPLQDIRPMEREPREPESTP